MGNKGFRPNMAALLLILVCLVSWAHASAGCRFAPANGYRSNPPDLEEVALSLFKSWAAEHEKQYSDRDEESLRFEVFKNNLKYINDHNANAMGQEYSLSLNKFADLTHEEFKARYVGTKFARKSSQPRKTTFRYRDLDAPSAVDWRTTGATSPVKDQGSCGSCWAFSTTGAVEGINHITKGSLVPLSEQELMDCDTERNQGCNGGWMDYAFEFIIGNGGIDSEADYPYKGVGSSCVKAKLKSHVASIDSYEDVPHNDESALKKAVAGQPASVSIEASGRDFQFYSSGVFKGVCGTELDHGVLAVGYGHTLGRPYWIVKNSWGSGWGEEGYIRMERNIHSTTGKCGIAMEASYPVINTGKTAASDANAVPLRLVSDM